MRKTLAEFLLCYIPLSSCITSKKYDYIANINEIFNAWKVEIGPYYDPIYFPADALSIISVDDRSYIGLRMFYKNIEFDPYFIIFNR